MGPAVGILGVIALIALIGGVVWYQAKKRRDSMQQVAAAMGFTYRESMDDLPDSSLPLFNRGRSQEASNVLTGELAGHPAMALDFSYVTGSGKNRTTHHQTVALFPNGGEGLPAFELSPENIFHKIGQAFGYQDIDFPEHEEFSKRYLLRGEKEDDIRKVFNSEVLAFLAGKPGWSVETRGRALAVFRAERRVKPEEIPVFLADALTIMNGLTRADAPG